MNQFKKSKFTRLVEFIRDYRIHVPSGEEFRGIKDTLIGWAIVGFCTVVFEPISDPLVLEISFIVIYFSGALAILLNVGFDGLLKGRFVANLKDLLITTKTDQEAHEAHLSVNQRITAIYLRSFLATGGYIALNLAKVYFGAIDNSQIFGADALAFVLLSAWILGERRNIKEWAGIILACSGVTFILFLDISSFNWVNGLISGAAGLYSATAFAVIFFITTIIVRHDTPKRIVFHQCFVGVIVALCAFLINLIIAYHKSIDFFPNISMSVIKNSIILGVLYATALYRFLRAFLFTNPVIIAVLGYSFVVFTLIFEIIFNKVSIEAKDVFSSALISFGCAILLWEEHKKNKNEKKEVVASKPIYQNEALDASTSAHASQTDVKPRSLKRVFKSLKERFDAGLLDRYSYVSERHEFNKVLLEYSSEIMNSDIASIKIAPEALVFTFKPLGIELETDGAARSAPFEVLNFGSYEPEDEALVYNLVKNGNVVLDIGANIGWYTVNCAIRFPDAKIYAFEPILPTYEVLKRNVDQSRVANCILFNYGISDKDEEKTFYYFKGGSAIASIQNLLSHPGAKEVKCKLKPLDLVVQELGLKSVDFIKCDVEGSELFVLRGAERTIKTFQPILFIEICEEWSRKCGYSARDIIEFLSSCGYALFEASGGKLYRRETIKSEDNGRYNYFFLKDDYHMDLIRKFST